jgi:virginiamycin B lyase
MTRTFPLLALCSWLPVVCAAGESPAPAGGALPAGNGHEIAAAHCVTCHDSGRLVTPGYTRAGWQEVIEHMKKLGVVLSSDEQAVLTDYLAGSFPPQSQPAPQLIGGATQISFREWPVATPGAFPHDPLATADGAIWYTGQRASVLGRIDPRSGASREFPTSIPDSGPHGLTADAAGHIWFTANYAGYIGRLDPQSGEITAYRMPDPRARDPHTPVFDQSGVLWFSVQGANMVGRLDPKSGAVRLIEVPTAHALPYGIAVSSKGVPFFAEFGSHRIGSIDPHTLTIHEYLLPEAAARPRRIAIDSHDVIWYTDYARGFLGRFDPANGAAREWASPGGPHSAPYGITVLEDTVWYSESGVTPNTLVRFDPKSGAFQSWPIPSGGGVVRNMMPTADHSGLVLAESGAGKLALVEVLQAR